MEYLTWKAIKAFLAGIPSWVWILLFLVASHATVYYVGYADGVEHQAQKAAKAIARQTVKQDKVTVKVVTKYVDRVQVIREKAKTIIQKVPVYVTAKADAQCVIPGSFVQLWNYANEGSIPEAASGIDEAPSEVKLSEVAAQHATEAEMYNATAAQLEALQEWVRQQEAIN